MSELEFWKDLGNIFDSVMNYQKKNVEFNNRFINPWIRLGNVFERQDQANDAVQAYQRATELDPDSPQNWIELGDAQFKKGDYDQAVGAYNTAVKLDPEAGWPLGNLALSMVMQGKIEEAVPLYKKSIELLTEVKDKAICWNRLGNAYRKLNDYENAFLAFQKADQLDGDNTGFSDKLDEVPSSTSVVASEEILEQLIVDQVPAEVESEAAPVATEPEAQAEAIDVADVNEVVEPISEPEAVLTDSELLVDNTAQEEVAEEIAAILPNMEMEIATEDLPAEEEPVAALEEAAVEQTSIENTVEAEEETPLTLHEKKFSLIQIVENVIAKVEQAYAEQRNSADKEEQESESIAEETKVEAESTAPETEAVAAPEGEAVSEEAVEAVAPKRIPEWLVIHNAWKVNSSEPAVDANVQQDVPQAEAAMTLSDISQEAAVSESTVNMDIVETYTEPLAIQAEEEVEPSEALASSEIVAEPVAVEETQEIAATEESIPAAATEELESEDLPAIVSEEQITELAYEEYLKDIVEPAKLADETQGEIPATKVSKSGDMRIEMDTKNAHVWNELGNIYLNAGTCDEAIASYSKAIELDRHFAWPYSNLALAYVQKGRFAEAILLYQRGIELFTSDRDKAITWNRLGNVYRRINDYSNAIASYQTADELDPENATLSLRSSFGLLGNLYSDKKPAYIA